MIRCNTATNTTALIGLNRIEQEWSDPLAALDWMSRNTSGGYWVGYLSYELGKLFERLPGLPVDPLGLPLFVFTYHESNAGAVTASDAPMAPNTTTVPRSNFTRGQYESAVARAIQFIRDGDVFQVNLSQRFIAEISDSPAEIYRRLISATPAGFGAFLDYGEFALLGNSPELFIRVDPARRIVTRPIKGTRANLPGMEEELRESSKDQAELNMVVDLERNDLGRICKVGSVRVTEPRRIEAHPTVYHGVAEIAGELREEVGFVDILRAMFPGGSVTGAPKIRAMEIIGGLERVGRGPYCGAVGYLGPDGSMEFNVAIRTMIIKDGRAHISVGGGVVADSQPAQEYEETLVKAKALFAALGITM
jgi:anthranilate/para-aminobenzoate synthase component I